MEPEGSLPHSQVPATCPYPKQNRQLWRLKTSKRWTTGKLIDIYNFLVLLHLPVAKSLDLLASSPVSFKKQPYLKFV